MDVLHHASSAERRLKAVYQKSLATAGRDEYSKEMHHEKSRLRTILYLATNMKLSRLELLITT